MKDSTHVRSAQTADLRLNWWQKSLHGFFFRKLLPRDLSLLFCKMSAECSLGTKRCHPIAFSGNRSGALGDSQTGFFPLPYI